MARHPFDRLVSAFRDKFGGETKRLSIPQNHKNKQFPFNSEHAIRGSHHDRLGKRIARRYRRRGGGMGWAEREERRENQAEVGGYGDKFTTLKR